MKACRVCEKKLHRQNKTGLCISHVNKDPDILARRGRAISKWRRQKLAEDPDFAAKARDHGAWLHREHGSRVIIPEEARVAAGRKISETRLGWCPPEYRDFYRKMMRNGHVTMTQARQRTLEKIAADRAKMTPFERQMAALKRGAPLVSAMIDRREYAFTLGGVSSL